MLVGRAGRRGTKGTLRRATQLEHPNRARQSPLSPPLTCPAVRLCRRSSGGGCTGQFLPGAESGHNRAYQARLREIRLLRRRATDGATNTMIRENRGTTRPRDQLRFRRCACGSRWLPLRGALPRSLGASVRGNLPFGHYCLYALHELRVTIHASRFEEVLNLDIQLMYGGVQGREP